MLLVSVTIKVLPAAVEGTGGTAVVVSTEVVDSRGVAELLELEFNKLAVEGAEGVPGNCAAVFVCPCIGDGTITVPQH